MGDQTNNGRDSAKARISDRVRETECMNELG